MTNPGGSGQRRKFASKYSHKGAGITMLVLAIAALANGDGSLYSIGLALAFTAFGVYLLRGQGLSPSRQEKLNAKNEAQKSRIESAIAKLRSATGGAAVVAYRQLEKLVKNPNSTYPDTLEEILSSINFDITKIQSDLVGTLPKFGLLGTPVEVYRDWIIYGDEAYDVDSSTRGEVHIDGAITFDAKNNKRDLRKASIQFVSAAWSRSFSFDPDKADLARRIVSQLSVIVDSQKPAGVTTSDIKAMIDLILSNTGQPAAEKLKQLSDLRFQRLLSDDEFEAAKAKVLGI